LRKPKYSIALPTLYGEETLSVTLPEMAKFERDDVEWVISDNLSEDKTPKIVRALNDPRFRLVQPPKRLTAGENLEFAYSQARGEWVSHLGDDDYLFPSRFAILDHIVKETGADVIRGEHVRYHWPNYYDNTLANTLDPLLCNGDVQVFDGPSIAKRSLNERLVYGGGAWCFRADIVEKVRRRTGFFSSGKHLEFFCARAAQLLADRVAYIGLPIYVMGRHSKSSASQAFAQKGKNPRESWNWEFEVPEWDYCPFSFKGYSTVSFDGSLLIKDRFAEELQNVQINWLYWIFQVRSEIDNMISRGQIPPNAKREYLRALRKVPFPSSLLGVAIHPRISRKILMIAKGLIRRLRRCQSSDISPVFGWPGRLSGGKVGIYGITDVPRWVEQTFPGYFDL